MGLCNFPLRINFIDDDELARREIVTAVMSGGVQLRFAYPERLWILSCLMLWQSADFEHTGTS